MKNDHFMQILLNQFINPTFLMNYDGQLMKLMMQKN